MPRKRLTDAPNWLSVQFWQTRVSLSDSENKLCSWLEANGTERQKAREQTALSSLSGTWPCSASGTGSSCEPLRLSAVYICTAATVPATLCKLADRRGRVASATRRPETPTWLMSFFFVNSLAQCCHLFRGLKSNPAVAGVAFSSLTAELNAPVKCKTRLFQSTSRFHEQIVAYKANNDT